MIPRPPNPPRRIAAGRTLWPAAVLAVLLLASCGTGPSPRPASRLVVLAGFRDGASLTIRRADGADAAVTLPGGDASWIAADEEGRLVATLPDGGLWITIRPIGDGQPVWLAIDTRPTGAPAQAPAAPLAFGIPDGAGRRVAALAAVFGSGEPATLVILELDGGPGRMIPLGREAQGTAPAWLSPSRLAAVVLDRTGEPAIAVVDPAGPTVRDGPPGIGAIAVSGDAGRVATVSADGRTVEVRAADGWPAPLPSATLPPLISIQPPMLGVALDLALDARGESLAVVWSDPDLAPQAVVRYDAEAGWREVDRVSLHPATVRAAVAFVP